MVIIRGTTPTININITSELDLTDVTQVWAYITQYNGLKVDKLISDVDVQPDNDRIVLTLTQTDTLKLDAGKALFQIRLLLDDGTALADVAEEFDVLEVYKGGIIA